MVNSFLKQLTFVNVLYKCVILCSKALKSSSPLFSNMTSTFILSNVTTFFFISFIFPSASFFLSRRALHTQKRIYTHSPFALKGNKRTSTCQTFITARLSPAPFRPCKLRCCSSHNPQSSLSLSTGTIMKRQCHTTIYSAQAKPCLSVFNAFSKVRHFLPQ